MDEILTTLETEVHIDVPMGETIEVEPTVKDLETEVEAELTVEDIGSDVTEVIEIDMEESIGWSSGDGTNHHTLYGRDDPDQHIIESITGLRGELDEIERLKPVCSDKFNIANYYKWKDAAYDEYGYFVSIVPGTSEIEICNGSDIFGVSIAPKSAGFVGGENATVPRDNTYGLIATSGLVDVRCELEINVGDYVVSNASGYAKKSGSNFGYKVLALKNQQNGYHTSYAVISLDMQADRTNAIGENLQRVEAQVDANYKNIVSAINVANQAYNKSSEATSISQDALKDALDALTQSEKTAEKVQEALGTAQSASSVAAQARAIAEGVVTATNTLTTEATNRANDAWAKADEVQKETSSLCAKIDQHSVGEYSQSYNLTVEQAQGIVKPGIIYAPTENHSEVYTYTNNIERVDVWDESAITDNSKVYYVIDEEGGRTYYHYESSGWKEYSDVPAYIRKFTAEYLYMWGYLPAMEIYGWITVDKFYNKIEDDELNDSHKAVYFFKKPIDVSQYDNFGYWYTDSDEPEDSEGKIGIYEPYTLYKWEDGNWLAVATLKGNMSNRMVSEVYQTSNEIMMGVINPRGGIAAFDAILTDTEAKVQQLAAWKNGEDESKAIIYQEADDDGARIVISTVTTEGDKDSEARLVLTADKNNSALCINANNINFEADDFSLSASKIDFTTDDFEIDASHIINLEAPEINLDGYVTLTNLREHDGATFINGANIDTGTIDASQIAANAITADKIATDAITSRNYYIKDENGNDTEEKSGEGMKLDLSNGTWDSEHFKIDAVGAVTATEGDIAGWNIAEDGISRDNVGMHSGDTSYASLVNDNTKSPVRFYAGGQGESYVKTATLTFTSTGESLTQTITLSEEEQEAYEIVDAKCVTTTKVHSGSVTQRAIVTTGTTPLIGADGEVVFSGNTTISLLPTWVSANHITTLTTQNEALSLAYIGNGEVRVSTYSESPSATVTDFITAEYSFEETLDVNVVYDNATVSIVFNPQTTDIEYDIDVEYTLYAKEYRNFMVLEDGSLYANTAQISGDIRAYSGQIGGYALNNNVLASGSQDTRVILDASENSNYAFSAGSETPGIAPFSVTKDGLMSATGGSFMGDLNTSNCMIGPIIFNNKSFNISRITIKFSKFKNTSVQLSISARDENRISGRKGQIHYNYYNGSMWSTTSKDFTTGGSSEISTSYSVSLNNATKVIYTKPHIAWNFEDIQSKGVDIATLLSSGDWEEKSFTSFNGIYTTDSYLYLHQGSAVIFVDNDNNFLSMFHFPLMKNFYGDISENIITASDTSASMVCGGGTFDTNTQPGFYLGVDGFRLGNMTGAECTIRPDGTIWCKKLYVYTDNGYIDVGEKLKNL